MWGQMGTAMAACERCHTSWYAQLNAVNPFYPRPGMIEAAAEYREDAEVKAKFQAQKSYRRAAGALSWTSITLSHYVTVMYIHCVRRICKVDSRVNNARCAPS